ncbi:hypothetical protein QYF61_015859, partial [Mycteria americana]
MRGSRHKLKHERFGLDVKKSLFTTKTVKHWKRLYREVVQSPEVLGDTAVPTRDTPTRDTPTRDTPTRDTPTRDTPTRDTPTRDGGAELTHTDFPMKLGFYVAGERRRGGKQAASAALRRPLQQPHAAPATAAQAGPARPQEYFGKNTALSMSACLEHSCISFFWQRQ